MADPISWYALGRLVNDPETILEAVDTKVLTHNLDPSAHGQENEVVWAHRVEPLLDHLSYTIYNIKLNPAARVFKAIVGSGLEGDFTTIQAAIDWANLYGGGTIFIKNGIYTLAADLTLYSNISLLGEDNDSTIIDCGNASNSLRAVGVLGTHLRNITIENVKIRNNTSTTEGAIYFSYVDDSFIKDCIFTNNINSGAGYGQDIKLSNCQRILIETNYSYDSDTFVDTNAGGSIIVRNNAVSNVLNDAIELDSSYAVQVVLNSIDTTGNSGIILTGCNFCKVALNDLGGITDYGVYLNNSPRNVIATNTFWDSGASSESIRLASTTTYVTIVGNSIGANNTKGIHFVGGDKCVISGNVIADCDIDAVDLDSGCDYNIVTNNQFLGSGYTDGGTGNVFANNIDV